MPLTDAILAVPASAWAPAVEPDGDIRHCAWVAELAGDCLTGWPAERTGVRVFPAHPTGTVESGVHPARQQGPIPAHGQPTQPKRPAGRSGGPSWHAEARSATRGAGCGQPLEGGYGVGAPDPVDRAGVAVAGHQQTL